MKSGGKSSMGRYSRAEMAKASSLSRLNTAWSRSLGGFQILILTLLKKNPVETCREEGKHEHPFTGIPILQRNQLRDKVSALTIEKSLSFSKFHSGLSGHSGIALPLWVPEQALLKDQEGRNPTTGPSISIHCFA